MQNFAADGISSQIIVIFTLVLIVAILLVVIIFLDRKEKLKRNKNNELDDYDENFTFEDLYQKNSTEEIKSNPVVMEPIKDELTELSDTVILNNQTLESIEPSDTKITEINTSTINLPEIKEEIKVVEQMNINLPITEPSNTEVNEETISTEQLPDSDKHQFFTSDEVYQDEELEKTQAQLELKRLTEELEKAAKNDEGVKLTNFEVEQEENAIISLEELTKISDKLYDENEKVQYEDDGNEPITIEQLRNKFKEEKFEQVTLDEFIVKEEVIEPKTEIADNNNFKKSPIISPVYGIEPSISIKEKQEETKESTTQDDLNEELKKTSEFLQTLKELRKSLE